MVKHRKKKVLICLHEPQRLSYFIRLIKLEKKNYDFTLITSFYHGLKIDGCTNQYVVKKWNSFFVIKLCRIIGTYAATRVLKFRFEKIFKTVLHEFINHDLILLTSDRSLGDLPFIYLARKYRLKIYILSGARQGNLDSIKKYRKLHNYNNKLNYYPNYLAKILYHLKIISNNPFVIGKGESDKILLHSIEQVNALTKEGVDRSKIEIIQDPQINLIIKKRRELLKIKKNKSYIFLSLPQWYEHNLCSLNYQLEQFDCLFNTIDKYNKLKELKISLHPKADVTNYNLLLKKYMLESSLVDMIDGMATTNYLICTYSSLIDISKILYIKTSVWLPSEIKLEFDIQSSFDLIQDLSNLKFDKMNPLKNFNDVYEKSIII